MKLFGTKSLQQIRNENKKRASNGPIPFAKAMAEKVKSFTIEHAMR